MAGALNALYGRDGFEFLHLKDIPGAVGDDVVWADVYKQFGGRIVLSGDYRIGARPHEAVAFIDNGFLSFFPDGRWAQMRLADKAASLVYWWPLVRQVVESNEKLPGGCWKIPLTLRDGELRLSRVDLEPMVIPEEVLESARRARGR